MGLGDDHDFPPYSRGGTSFQAALGVAGSAARQGRERALKFIRDRGEFGATDDELIHELGMAHNTVHPRRWELAGLNRAADYPTLIAHNGEKRPTVRGKLAMVWVAIGANAFTLGNPDSYEPMIAERLAADEVPMKAAGGIAYTTRGEAQAVIDAAGGKIPPEWVSGADMPGRVYGLQLPKSFEKCTKKDPHGRGWLLAVSAPLVRL